MLPEEDVFPRFGKFENGHDVEVFPIFTSDGDLAEVAYQCHTCDSGLTCKIEGIVSWVTAYYHIGEMANDHVGIPLETREKDYGKEDKQE